MRPTWAEIDLAAIAHNLAELRQRAGARRVIAVVKADAYGHGAAAVATRLEASGCEALAVSTLAEAEALCASGVRVPILLLQGPHETGEAEAVVATGCVPLVGRADPLEALAGAAQRAGRVLPIHLKFDTGMSRLGFMPDELDFVLARLRELPALEVTGICSHLAEADDAKAASVAVQRARFAELLERARLGGIAPSWIHLDNSAGIANGPTPDTTAVRPGVALYGVDPTDGGLAGLEPAMSVWSRILETREVSAGTRVGYGGTWQAAERTRIATLPMGYADGLPRAAGNRLELGLHGQRVPLVGRVSMDLATLALPRSGPAAYAAAGDPVLVFGRDAPTGLVIRSEEQARAIDGIAYELLVGIGARVPRVAR